MSTTVAVYVCIGNSDDKLAQHEWSKFVADVRDALRNLAHHTHGEWFSAPDSRWQSACWCIDVRHMMVSELRARLADIAQTWRQDSIAWSTAQTEFLTP